jgi:hypothetical protein
MTHPKVFLGQERVASGRSRGCKHLGSATLYITACAADVNARVAAVNSVAANNSMSIR